MTAGVSRPELSRSARVMLLSAGFPAIIVERIPPDVTCDLRVDKRQQPQPTMKITLGDDCLEIVNISSSGAHLVRTAGKRVSLNVGDTILLTVQDDADISYRYARIIRQWHSKGADGPEHLAVVFTAEKKQSGNSLIIFD